MKINQTGMTQLGRDIDGTMSRLADEMLNNSRRIVPVDTGRLKASLKKEELTNTDTLSKKKYRVGSDVEYANYVEQGTTKMAAQPYLTPQIENTELYLRKIRNR